MAQIQLVQVCNLCDSEENVNWYCTNCDETLCDNCKKIHLRTKRNKNDNVITFQDARCVQRSAVTLCNHHPTEVCKFYCKTCQESVCAICLHVNHQEHKWTLLETYTNSKRESLKRLLEELNIVDSIKSEAAKKEESAHGSLITRVDEANHTIDNQEAKAKEKISELCNFHHSTVSKIKDDENKRHQSVSNVFQTQNKRIKTTIHKTQIIIDKANLSEIIQVEKEAIRTLEQQRALFPTLLLTIPRFEFGDISDQAITNIIGIFQTNVNDTTAQPNQTGYTKQTKNYEKELQSSDEDEGAGPNNTKLERSQDPQSTETNWGAIQKENTDKTKKSKTRRQIRNEDSHTQEPKCSGNNPKSGKYEEIDVIEVKAKSVIHVLGMSSTNSSIGSIVPLDNNKMWVVEHDKKHLTLIDCNGDFIKKSVSVNEGGYIYDVKLHNSEMLITCYKGQQVIRMSSDGITLSKFCKIPLHYTKGLCVGNGNDVLVIFVKSAPFKLFEEEPESKIMRFNESGVMIQVIQPDYAGAPLFTVPKLLTSLQSGDIIVTDKYKIITIDKEGKHLFTWTGEKEGVKGEKIDPLCITHDRHNHVFVTCYYNGKVYVMGREGRGSTCLLDSKQGIHWPHGIATNNDGQLLVGSGRGKLHIIDY